MNQQWSYYSQRIVTCTVSLAVVMLLVACGGTTGSGSNVTPTPQKTVTPSFTPFFEATVMVMTAYGKYDGAGPLPGDDGDKCCGIIAELAGSLHPQTLIVFVTDKTTFDHVKQLSPGMLFQVIAQVEPPKTSEDKSSTAKAVKNNPGAINDDLVATKVSPPNSNDPFGSVVIYQGQTTQDVSTDSRIHFNVGSALTFDFAIDPKVLSTAQSIKQSSFVKVTVEFKNSKGERCSYSDTGCTGTATSVESAS